MLFSPHERSLQIFARFSNRFAGHSEPFALPEGGGISRARNSLFQLIILLSSPLYFSRTDGTKNGPSFLLKKLNKQWKRRERKERFKSELVLSRNLSFFLFRFFEKFFFFFVCVYTRWEYFFLSFVKKKYLKWRMELEWW